MGENLESYFHKQARVREMSYDGRAVGQQQQPNMFKISLNVALAVEKKNLLKGSGMISSVSSSAKSHL